MNDEPFLHEIAESRFSLSSRLVYADWKEEHGACEIAKMLHEGSLTLLPDVVADDVG